MHLADEGPGSAADHTHLQLPVECHCLLLSIKHSRAKTDNFRRFTNLPFFQKKPPPGQKHLLVIIKIRAGKATHSFGRFQSLDSIEVFSLLKLTGFQEKGTISPYATAI
jgi:hypothetical protein